VVVGLSAAAVTGVVVVFVVVGGAKVTVVVVLLPTPLGVDVALRERGGGEEWPNASALPTVRPTTAAARTPRATIRRRVTAPRYVRRLAVRRCQTGCLLMNPAAPAIIRDTGSIRVRAAGVVTCNTLSP
jgi:hypothetical protein